MKKNFITCTLILFSFLTSIKAQIWSIDSLSSGRRPTTVATLDSKIVVIGGNLTSGNAITEIYDDVTKKWTVSTPLSFQEFEIKAIPIGNKLYCFQGFNPVTGEPSQYMDVYNATSNVWKKDSLPFIPNEVGAEAIGSKLFIAGGLETTPTSISASNIVRIFDTVTQKWTYSPSLSVARRDIEVIKVKNKLLFIGGYSVNPNNNWTFYKNIDIYDATTGLWSTVLMKTGRVNPKVTVSGSKVLIVGGIYKLDFVAAAPTLFFTKSVEVYDVDNDTWQTSDLPVARISNGIATYDKKAYMISGMVEDESPFSRSIYKKMNVYDFVTNTWSEQPLPAPELARTGYTIGLKNKIFFIGGALEDFSRTSRIDILTLPLSNIFEPTILTNKLTLFPNPVSGDLSIDFEKGDIHEYDIKISNALGQTVYNKKGVLQNNTKIDVENFNKGVYFLSINTQQGVKNSTFIKQ